MPTYTPTQVAQMVLNQGGTKAQAWVAAALVDGIESSGSTTAKNPSSTACGLFQFLTTTWDSNGGSQYASTACGATGEQQVAVFLKASAGSNFYAWAPDMGGSYNGNNKQPAATTPQAGSPVGDKILSLSNSGLGALLGNIPSGWASSTDPGAATGLSSPTQGQLPFSGPNPASAGTTQTCAWSISFGILGKVCLLSYSQIKWLSGVAALLGGATIGILGVVVVAAAMGAPTPSLPSLPRRAMQSVPETEAPADDSQDAFAAGMAQGQSGNREYQSSRRGYERNREMARRAGAPLSKSRPADF